jgi:hypothetical protein
MAEDKEDVALTMAAEGASVAKRSVVLSKHVVVKGTTRPSKAKAVPLSFKVIPLWCEQENLGWSMFFGLVCER